MTESAPVFDVVIAGGAASGLALAAAVKRALGAGAAVAVVDPAPPCAAEAGRPRLRTVAIAEGPRRLLESVGAWEAIAPKAQAILSMEIMDGEVRDAVRLPHLHFDAKGGAPLAHMAFNDDVIAALSSLCARLGVECVAGAVARFSSGQRVAELALADGRRLRTRLAVAADGARSKLRTLAAVPAYGWDYDQSGIVATIAHERDHEGVAQQHFLPAGPFAVLPLPGRRSSIVWNERRADARALMALQPEDFLGQLELRFTPKLGELRLASRVEAFPFRFQIARRFVGGRLALVGDAAHVVHPIAGQGLNLGLRDVAALAEAIVGEMRLGLDPGAPGPLAAYERARRFDVAASGMGMDVMNRLFSNAFGPLRFARDLGLRLVDRAPPLKDLLIAEAGGAGRGAPKLLRGVAL
ncbi:MAG TPA: FAD-dependent monooxygenase [Roseiarcus sp.]|nr:FAD-dependent monooxygenase [Roseiarcus sp.]